MTQVNPGNDAVPSQAPHPAPNAVPNVAPGMAPNSTSAALLGLLHTGPMTGGQLVAAASARFGPYFSVTRSQVYRELPVLAEGGLLRLGEQGARSSQQYAITPEGKRAFRSWLQSGEGADQLRSPLILRVRHAGLLTPRQRRSMVEQGRLVYQERLAAAEQTAKTVAGRAKPDAYEQAVAEFAIAHNRAMLALLDAVPVS